MNTILGVIFDIDGVITYQGRLFPGAPQAVDSLRRAGLTLRFLTNSTLKSRLSCAASLRQAGVQVFDEEVLTASYLTAVYLRQLKPRSVWVMLERDGVQEFADFTQDLENPEYIVIGDNRSNFDFYHLGKALRLLCNGSKLIGMIPELVDSSLGELELNVGAWVRMLELASGVPAIYIGKPYRFAYEQTLQSMGLRKDQVIAVGDRIGSDIQGANDFGILSVLVRTGEYKNELLRRDAFDERAAPALQNGELPKKDLLHSPQPDYVIDSIQDLPAILFA